MPGLQYLLCVCGRGWLWEAGFAYCNVSINISRLLSSAYAYCLSNVYSMPYFPKEQKLPRIWRHRQGHVCSFADLGEKGQVEWGRLSPQHRQVLGPGVLGETEN